LGSIGGSIMGAAFIILVPIFLTNFPPMVGLDISTALQKHLEEIIFGVMIVFFLIVEPEGFARLWQICREKLRKWPFPY
ncbi:MAG: branched-chain amino acid ABC transporter permease, partial [Rhodospirillales bacterium]